MSKILRLMCRRFTSDALDARVGQFVCWVGAVLVLMLGFYKLLRLSLTEVELFFGLLLVSAVSLLCVLIGLVLPIALRSGLPNDQAARG